MRKGLITSHQTEKFGYIYHDNHLVAMIGKEQIFIYKLTMTTSEYEDFLFVLNFEKERL